MIKKETANIEEQIIDVAHKTQLKKKILTNVDIIYYYVD